MNNEIAFNKLIYLYNLFQMRQKLNIYIIDRLASFDCFFVIGFKKMIFFLLK